MVIDQDSEAGKRTRDSPQAEQLLVITRTIKFIVQTRAHYSERKSGLLIIKAG
jgi:hypothetical protein